MPVPDRKQADKRQAVLRVAAVFCAAFTFVAPFPGTATSASKDTRIKAKYVLTISGLKVGELRFIGELDEKSYHLTGSGNISGLVQFFTTFKGETESKGIFENAAPKPSLHSISYNTVKRDYATRITFGDNEVTSLSLQPPFKAKRSRVPVLETHKTDAIDPLSAAVIPAHKTGPVLTEAACDRTISVFDGRERFDLALSFKGIGNVKAREAGSYAGPVVVCHVNYIPIAGHRRDDVFMAKLSESDSIEVWFAPIENARALALYRARVPTPFGRAVVFPKVFVVSTPKPQG